MEQSYPATPARLRQIITTTHLKWAIVLLGAFALRLLMVWLLKWNNPDGDDAVAGLAAKHISEGRELPVFFYGQDYFGALESYLNAALFIVFGFRPNLIFVLPFLFCMGLICAEYVFVNALLDPATARLSALVIAIGPAMLMLSNLGAGGGFALGLLLEMLALWLFARLYFRQDRRRVVWFGFCVISGLACWVWQLYIPILVVLVALGALRRIPITRGDLILGTGAFLLASSPLWIYNVQHGGATFSEALFKVGVESEPGNLPAMLAAAFNERVQNLWWYVRLWIKAPGAGNLVLTALVGLGVAANWRNIQIRRQGGALQLSPLAFGMLIAGVGFLVGNRQLHYLFIVPLVLLPLALQGWQSVRRVPTALVVAVILVTNLYTVWTVAITGVRHPNRDAVITQLDARGIVYGYSDYWSAYPITFLTGERIIVSPRLMTFDKVRLDRYPKYSTEVLRAERVFVLVPDYTPDAIPLAEIADASTGAPPRARVDTSEGILYFPTGRDDALRVWVESRDPFENLNVVPTE